MTVLQGWSRRKCQITWGYFDWDRKDYIRTSLREQLEVLTMTGNVAVKNGEPAIHAHLVLGRADGSAVGGHLLEAHVRPTLEVVAIETPSYLRRRADDETGLALIDLESSRLSPPDRTPDRQ